MYVRVRVHLEAMKALAEFVISRVFFFGVLMFHKCSGYYGRIPDRDGQLHFAITSRMGLMICENAFVAQFCDKTCAHSLLCSTPAEVRLNVFKTACSPLLVLVFARSGPPRWAVGWETLYYVNGVEKKS